MSKLKGKVALVTGAGQGVGQGIAFALAQEGVAVAVTGRTLSKVEKTAAEIIKRGGKALALECDVKDAASLQRSVEQTVKQFGALNILVNNAQEVPLGPLLAVSDEGFTAGWDSGPLATFRLMKLCHPHLKGGGCIINLASPAAMRWDASNYGVYAAVKEAIRSLTRAAACEWAKDGRKPPPSSPPCRCSASANARPISAASSSRCARRTAATSTGRASRWMADRLTWAEQLKRHTGESPYPERPRAVKRRDMTSGFRLSPE